MGLVQLNCQLLDIHTMGILIANIIGPSWTRSHESWGAEVRKGKVWTPPSLLQAQLSGWNRFSPLFPAHCSPRKQLALDRKELLQRGGMRQKSPSVSGFYWWIMGSLTMAGNKLWLPVIAFSLRDPFLSQPCSLSFWALNQQLPGL